MPDMEDLYYFVRELDRQHPGPVINNVVKVQEEAGELAGALLKLERRKPRQGVPDIILEEQFLGELGDVIVAAFSVGTCRGYTFEQVRLAVERGCLRWENHQRTHAY